MTTKKAEKKAKKKARTEQAQASVRLVEVCEQEISENGGTETSNGGASLPSCVPPPEVTNGKPETISSLEKPAPEFETTKEVSNATLAEIKALVDASGPGNQGDSTSQTQGKSDVASNLVKEAGWCFLPHVKSCLSWLWSLRAPLLLLGAIALVPKLILLWIFIILAKPITIWMYKHCPEKWKARFKLSLPPAIRDSVLMRDLSEGADQGLPFVLFWMYLFFAPFAIAWIAVDWMKGFIKPPAQTSGDGCFVFTQNKRQDLQYAENNFYHSRAFAVVLLAFFALGIPSFISYAVYEKLGVQKMIGADRPSPAVFSTTILPLPDKPKMGVASRPKTKIDKKRIEFQSPTGADSTAVMGYNGYWPFVGAYGMKVSKLSVFFVHFYLVSLASALCVLFFRAWFLFPLNFLSDEHDVEFTESGIRRKTMKSWFLSVITFNRWAIGGGPDSLRWHEVRSVRFAEEGFFKLSPLPETAFKKESLTYKLLNKVAALIDGISNRPNSHDHLIFSSKDDPGDFGQHIKIDLKDLSREQRARLFYSLKKWAPHVAIDKVAEEKLLGSTVLRDNRYTQLWFDMLTSRVQTKRKNVLASGEVLKDGEYVIDDRISSGGQATTYLATKRSGEKCVLKEFILSTSTTSGALIESAREFEAEVSLLSQLNHPGIVQLQDFFSEDRRLYVALEYIPGQSLRQKVQSEGPLSEREVVQMARSICDVLEYLHTSNPPIVHRDITPENILVESNGKIKIIDFSLAVKQDGRQTTDSCAKQAFTPPEQFREEVCVQSDIYALGATMYFLLTGLTPKPISSSSPKTKAPHISEKLNAIVERATQLDLNKRFESVQWMKVDLGNIRSEIET